MKNEQKYRHQVKSLKARGSCRRKPCDFLIFWLVCWNAFLLSFWKRQACRKRRRNVNGCWKKGGKGCWEELLKRNEITKLYYQIINSLSPWINIIIDKTCLSFLKRNPWGNISSKRSALKSRNSRKQRSHWATQHLAAFSLASVLSKASFLFS